MQHTDMLADHCTCSVPGHNSLASKNIPLQLRYQEIAEHAFNVIQKRALHENQPKQKLRHAPQSLNVFIAQEVYRVLLFTIFLAQVMIVRHVPYIGKKCSILSENGLLYFL